MGSDQKYIPAGAVVEHNCTSDYATCTPQQQQSFPQKGVQVLRLW